MYTNLYKNWLTLIVSLSHSHVTLMLCDIHNIFTTQCTMLQDKTNMHFDQAHQHNLLL